MAEGHIYYNIDSTDHSDDPEPKPAFQPEIGRDCCRVKREEWYGGYRNDFLTEDLTEREKVVLICKICKGIMKEACISSIGEQFCSCCDKRGSFSMQAPNLSVREMINSLECSCPFIERGCKWLGTLESCQNHLDTCGYVYEKCKLLECGVVLEREELRIHEKDKCPQRNVQCDHCDNGFKSCELNKHLKKCLKMEVQCDLCDINITRDDMQQHLNHDCSMVLDACRLGCGVELTRIEFGIHERDHCVERLLRCKHCYTIVKYCDEPKHLKECSKVKVACELCSVEKCRDDIPIHVKLYCLESEIECSFARFKCLERIKRKDMDKHLEEKQTEHFELKLTEPRFPGDRNKD